MFQLRNLTLYIPRTNYEFNRSLRRFLKEMSSITINNLSQISTTAITWALCVNPETCKEKKILLLLFSDKKDCAKCRSYAM